MTAEKFWGRVNAESTTRVVNSVVHVVLLEVQLMKSFPCVIGAGLVASVLVSIPQIAAQAAATCQGLPATISGSPGSSVVGTEGDDVIVSNGAAIVRGQGGSDRICMTLLTSSEERAYLVEGGDGNDDIVVADGPFVSLNASLGDGSDTYVGGSGSEVVWPGYDPGAAVPKATSGTDTVHTKGGKDTVIVGTPPGADQEAPTVDLGSGNDHLEVTGAGIAEQSDLAGGRGIDELAAGGAQAGQLIQIDTRDRTWNLDGEALVKDWNGFEDYTAGAAARGKTIFIGSRAHESFNFAGAGDMEAQMGAGNDVLTLDALSKTAGNDLFAGGKGRDRINVVNRSSTRATVDLDKRKVLFKNASILTLHLVEDASTATDDTLVGDGRANVLTGCGRIIGNGGDDMLRNGRIIERRFLEDQRNCGGQIPMLGGPGNDVLIGAARDDTLVGGPGRDKAIGNRGDDTCRAEVVRTC